MDRNKGIWGIIACIFIVGLAVTFTTSKYITHQEETGQMETTAAAAAETEAVMEAASAVPSPAAAPGEQGKAAAAGSMAGAPASVSSVSAGSGFEDATPPGPGASGTQFEDVQISEDATGAAAPQEDTAEEKNSSMLVEISPLEGPSATKAAGAQTGLREYYLTRLDDLAAQIQKMRAEETDSSTYSLKSAAENELKLWDNELNTIYSVILKQMNEEESKKLVEEERAWMKERDSLAADASQRYSGGTIESLEYTASLAGSTKARAYELVDKYFH